MTAGGMQRRFDVHKEKSIPAMRPRCSQALSPASMSSAATGNCCAYKRNNRNSFE